MGVVIQFPIPRSRLGPEERELLGRLTGEVRSLWRGGWAEPGLTDGVVLFRDQRVLGVWSFRSGEFLYVPIAHGVVTLRAPDVAQAFCLNLELLGPVRAG